MEGWDVKEFYGSHDVCGTIGFLVVLVVTLESGFLMSTISLCFELDFMVWLLGSQNAAIVIVVVTTYNKTLTTSNY
jgi:hypothetical protein